MCFCGNDIFQIVIIICKTRIRLELTNVVRIHDPCDRRAVERQPLETAQIRSNRASVLIKSHDFVELIPLSLGQRGKGFECSGICPHLF